MNKTFTFIVGVRKMLALWAF